MQHVFWEHIGPTVEAYIDDIIVKTKKADHLINDLDVAFKCLRANNIKLNPGKCVFDVPRGMLLGFIVSKRGIEANPEKITTITKMGPILDLKGVQRVTGCLAALSRFISRLAKLKATLSNSPILIPLTLGEPLLLYVAVTTQVVSTVLVVERVEEGHTLLIQRPVYFISEVLSETKVRYLQIQKLLYTIVLTRRKLRHYFEGHPVTVVSSFPLGDSLEPGSLG
jgi:hypothetical protein